MKLKDLFALGKDSVMELFEDRAFPEAAALAYYSMLSIPAFVLLIQWILGRVVSNQTQQQVIDLITTSVSGPGRDAITSMIENANRPGSGGALPTIVSLATLALSATAIVVHLEEALNRIWEIGERDKGIMKKIRERASSFLVVLALGAFLLLTVIASTAVSGFAGSITSSLGLGQWPLQGINAIVSLILLTLLFATAFKTIPDARVAWSDMWLGAFITAILFIIGQFALSIYLGKSAPGSAYGPAGAIVALVVWIYYSALILFLGAEFTQVYANRYGTKIRPDADALPLREKVAQTQAVPSREPATPTRPVTMTQMDQDTRPSRPAQFEPGEEQPPSETSFEYRRRVPAGARVKREEEGTFSYYTVAFLAVLLGVWRWLREE